MAGISGVKESPEYRLRNFRVGRLLGAIVAFCPQSCPLMIKMILHEALELFDFTYTSLYVGVAELAEEKDMKSPSCLCTRSGDKHFFRSTLWRVGKMS
jgi:hypothetical protein